jgi:hypothetical protein
MRILKLTTLAFEIAAMAAYGILLASSAHAAPAPPQGLAFVGTSGSTSGVWAASADASEQHFLESGAHGPALSPTGLEVGYVKNGCMYFMTVSGGTPLKDMCGFQSEPRDIEWSPYGQEFTFSSRLTSSTKGFAIYRSQGLGVAVELIDWPSDQISPTYAPSGTKVAFTSPTGPSGQSTGGSQIWIKEGDGFNENYYQLTGIAGAFAGPVTNPAWSPDGSEIAANAYHKSKGGKDPEAIALINSSTGAVDSWLLDSDNEYDTAPQWTPDGQSLVFTAETSSHSNHRLEEVKITGKGLHEVLPTFTTTEQVSTRRSSNLFPPDPDELLNRYRPQLRYDIQEQYFSDSAAEATDNPTNRLLASDDTVLAGHEEGLPVLSLQLLEEPAYADSSIDEGGETAEDAATLHANPEYANRLYGRTHFDPITGRWWLQYWMYYYYDSQEVLGIGVHEGDWETVGLRLTEEGVPDLAVYSRHADESAACPASDLEWAPGIGSGSPSPIVYVANASHANYLQAGDHDRSFPLPTDEAHGDGAIIRPELYEVTDGEAGTSSIIPHWFDWNGRWGSSGGGGFDQESPSSPPWQSGRWDDPQSYAEESVGNCNGGSTGSFSNAPTEGQEGPSGQGPLAISARPGGATSVSVDYRLNPQSGDARWVMVTVTSAVKLDSTRSRIVPVHSNTGTITLPRPAAPGPYLVTGSTYDKERERSEVTVTNVESP